MRRVIRLERFNGLIILLMVIGFPVVPIIDLPFLIFVIPFFFKEIRSALLLNSKQLLFFVIVISAYVTITFFVSNGAADLLFSLKILVKILLSIIAAIIVFSILVKNFSVIYFWLTIQTILISISIFNIEIYDFLLNFMSPASRPKFANIYGIRSLGFGLYHVDGALFFAFFCFLPLILGMNNRFLMLLSFISTTLSRSSLVFIGLLLFLRKTYFALLLFILLTYVSVFIDESFNSIYWALEVFKNFAENFSIFTTSTEVNKRMLIFPTGLDMLYGHGYYFSKEGTFYMRTDLGFSRTLYFGGVMYLFLYIYLNIAPLLSNTKSKQYLFSYIFLVIIFFLLNFKGIFISAFYISLVSLFFNKKACRKFKKTKTKVFDDFKK
jgi:hypothetical protein